jgi:hypothetical protein
MTTAPSCEPVRCPKCRVATNVRWANVEIGAMVGGEWTMVAVPVWTECRWCRFDRISVPRRPVASP